LGEHIIIYGYAENNTQQAFTILCWFIFSLNVKILILGSDVGVDPKLREKKVYLGQEMSISNLVHAKRFW